MAAATYDKLLGRFGPVIAAAYRRVMATARKEINERTLIDAIDARNMSALVDAIGLTEAQVFPLTEAVRSAYVGSGMSVGEAIRGGSFGFSALQPRAARWIAQSTARLVQGIQDTSRDVVTDIVRRGVLEGRPAAAMARDIIGRGRENAGSRLGLTTQQSQYVDNMRNDLQNLSANYFTRAQRDTRYDARVRNAIKNGKPLSEADIEKITGRYAERFEKYRATNVAREETRAAVASGQAEGYFQLQSSPEVERTTVRWQHNHGSQKTFRADHVAANGEVHDLGDPWVMDDGTAMLYPQDPNGGPAQNSGCRCVPIFRVVFRDK